MGIKKSSKFQRENKTFWICTEMSCCQFPAALSMSILTNSSMPCGSPMASARFSACERTWTEDSVKSRNGNPQSKISPSQTAAKLDLTFGLLIGVKKVKPKSSSKISNNFAWNLKPLAVCESKIGSKSKVHLQLIFFPEFSSKNNWKKLTLSWLVQLRSQPSWFSHGLGTRSPSLSNS